MKRLLTRGRICGAVLASALLLTLAPTSASAHYFGGKFPHSSGQWLYLGYTRSGSFYNEAGAAAASWHNTPTRLVVFPESYSSSEIDFYGYAYNATWWGYSINHPCYGSGCSYTWADEQLNTNTLNSETSFTRQKVATHEMGHGMGLAHTSDWWYSSIMKQGYLSYNTPQSHDINDINALYP